MAPKPPTWDELLAHIQALQQKVADLENWKAQVEAAWPKIVEVTNGAS